MRSLVFLALAGTVAAAGLGGALLTTGAFDTLTGSAPGVSSTTADPRGTPSPTIPGSAPGGPTSGPSPSSGSTTPNADAAGGEAGSARGESPDYRLPVAGCSVSYARTHHDYPAADMFADPGCRFVAPVDGVVDEVVREDTWDPQTNRGADRGGRSVSVVGVDGVRYYGSHLVHVAPGIRPGLRVEAGHVLGRVGESGSARGTGSHLHFGISWPTPHDRWWVRRGTVAPQSFLDSWRDGEDRSPASAVAKAHRRYGDDSHCRSYC